MFSGGGYFVGGAKSHAVSFQSVNRELVMKVRQPGQVTAAEVQARDLRLELEERERANFNSLRRERERAKGVGGGGLPILEDKAREGASAPAPTVEDDILAAFNDDDDDEPLLKAKEGLEDEEGGREEEEEEEEEDDEEDDAEELRRELERLRREKEAEKQRRQREADLLAEQQQKDSAVKNNPLLVGHLGEGGGGSGAPATFKRHFGDDTVFSNTHSGETDHLKKARFINDAVRSDFHRRFLARFVL